MAKLKKPKKVKESKVVSKVVEEVKVEIEPGLVEPEFASGAPVKIEESVVEVIEEPKKLKKLSPRDILRTEEVEINGKKYKKNYRFEGTTDLVE